VRESGQLLVTEFGRNEDGLQRTLRERVERFKDPARGINLEELAELLHLYFPQWFPDLRKTREWSHRLPRNDTSGIQNGHGRQSNLWWLYDPRAFADRVCGQIAVAESTRAHGSRLCPLGSVPPWFLDDPEAAAGFAMLACENAETT